MTTNRETIANRFRHLDAIAAQIAAAIAGGLAARDYPIGTRGGGKLAGLAELSWDIAEAVWTERRARFEKALDNDGHLEADAFATGIRDAASELAERRAQTDGVS